jgi:hypothetical protein
MIDAFDKILAFNNISLKLYFKTLQPLEFTDLTNVTDQETREEETGQKLALKKGMQIHRPNDHLTKEVAKLLIDMGEDEDLDGWEVISEDVVNYEKDDKQNEMLQLAVSTGSAKPASKSEQDSGLFKVRYRYAGKLTKNKNGDIVTRPFCEAMLKAKKIYRKEDIIAMDSQPVNAGWGEGGSDTYSIWLYKGGGNCHHAWNRVVYFRKRNDQGEFLPNKGITNDKRVTEAQAKSIAGGFTPEKNPKKVAQKPKDMARNGFAPSNPKY